VSSSSANSGPSAKSWVVALTLTVSPGGRLEIGELDPELRAER
jgi:hypothetical protein